MEPGHCFHLSTDNAGGTNERSRRAAVDVAPSVASRPGRLGQSNLPDIRGRRSPAIESPAIFPIKLIGRVWDRSDRDGIDGLVTDVESSAALAAMDGQPIALADPTRGPIPDLQSDAMTIGRAAIGEEELSAGRVGPGEDQLGSRHLDCALVCRWAESPASRAARPAVAQRHPAVDFMVGKAGGQRSGIPIGLPARQELNCWAIRT